jgi:SAM-dependent methyltransferase
MTTRTEAEPVEDFAGQLITTFTASMLTLMIDLGHRTGLLDTLAAGPGTSTELAERAGLAERYVREWLGALATGGIADYDPRSRRFVLPADRAACLTGAGSANLAPIAQLTALLAKNIDGVARAFVDGGGVSYEAFRPEFTGVMDGVSRGVLDGQLISGILPLTGGLPGRLAGGVRVADIGCGTGHAVNLLAREYPRSTFIGYDLSAEAIDAARTEAAAWRLPNARFEVLDVTRLPAEPPFEAVFAFDAVHDQVDPVAVLDRVHAALRPGGTFVMVDVKAASELGDNLGNPIAPFLYAISTLHCLTVSLAHGGAGLGTVWGEQLARHMLAEAGFVGVQVHDVPDDPFDVVYLARRGPVPR